MHQIFTGINRDVLKTFPDNSIDSLVTDPPYAYKFMGKKWDYELPSVEDWQEILRVLKPGAHALVACGTRTQHRMAVNLEDAGFEIKDIIAWLYGSGMPKGLNIGKKVDGWEGWNTQLKPSMEMWTLCFKPFSEKSITDNVIKWGVGGINIDECRTPLSEFGEDKRLGGNGSWGTENAAKNVYEGGYAGVRVSSSPDGRFPSNLIHDGSEEVVSSFPDAKGQQGDLTNHAREIQSPNGIYGKQPPRYDAIKREETEVSAARFFYAAKASKKEREAGLEPENGERANTHPTVKPISLMRYLCRLITPKGGTILDPYAGSGSTGCAAAVEGFNSILIEQDEQWKPKIEARIKYWENQIL